MLGGRKATILTQVGHLYLGRWVSFTSAVTELPDGVRYYVFDAAAASGVRQSILWLQRALGVAADGVLGPVTLAAAHVANPDRLKAHLLSQRLRFMAGLSNWPSFSRGWSRRVADLLEA